MRQHTLAHLQQHSRPAACTNSLRCEAVFEKEVYVLKLINYRSHEVHQALRSVVEASGGKYSVSSAGMYATVICDLETAQSLSATRDVASTAHVHGALKVDRRLQSCRSGSGVDDVKGLTVALAPMTHDQHVYVLRQLRTMSENLATTVDPDVTHADGKVSFVRVYAQNCENILAAAKAISVLSGVLFIEQTAKFLALNRYAHGTIQTSSTADRSVWDVGLTGSSQIIGVADTGIDLNSCYFYDSTGCDPRTGATTCRKVTHYYEYVDGTDTTESPGHGTHVTGSAVGQCTSTSGTNSLFDGMAYEAKIAFMDIGDSSGTLKTPTDLNTGLFTTIYGFGANVQSHSWANSDSYYDVSAHQADEFLVSNPSAALFIAAGNNGTSGLRTILSPSIAKNVVSVGASLSDYESFKALGETSYSSNVFTYTTVADFSSRGYADDGRLKPDVVAPGYWIGSALSDTGSSSQTCAQGYLAGTSMATPQTAGSALLVRQYFTEGWHPGGVKGQGTSFTPSGALLKAMMIHGAQKMKGVLSGNTLDSSINYPGPVQGYGRIQLDEVLRYSTNKAFTLLVLGASDSSSSYYDKFTATGQVEKIVVTITNESSILQPLKATLVWTDPAAALGSSRQLVNDLDLTIVGPTGKVYYPILTGTADHTNNVEKIEISTPTLSSNYTIQVKVYSLSTTSQSYALVITGTFLGESYVTPTIEYTSNDDNAFNSFLHSLGLSTGFSIGLLVAIVVVILACGVFYCFWTRIVKAIFQPQRRRQTQADVSNIRNLGYLQNQRPQLVAAQVHRGPNTDTYFFQDSRTTRRSQQSRRASELTQRSPRSADQTRRPSAPVSSHVSQQTRRSTSPSQPQPPQQTNFYASNEEQNI